MWGGSYFGYTQWVVADQVDEAVAFADASPPPPPEELFTDVYKD